MKCVTFGAPGEIEPLHRLLHQTIGVGDALVLAQMLHPGFHEERFQGYGHRRQRPRTRPSDRRRRAAARARACHRLEKRRRDPAGRMRYSTVTRTGPRSCAISCVVIGAGQCMDGVRSIPRRFAASTPSQRNGGEPCRRRQENVPPAARPCGNFAPGRAAERQATEKHRGVERQPAPAHPIRQRNLRGDAQRRQRRNPRRTRRSRSR